MNEPKAASSRGTRFVRDRLIFGALIGGQLALSGAGIFALSAQFYRSRRIVLLHVLIVAGLLGLSTATVFVLNQLTRTRFGKRLISSVIPSITTALLLLLYLADFFSNRAWGGNLTYQIVEMYGQFAMPNRPPFFVSTWIYVAILLGYILLFAIYWSSSNSVVRVLDRLSAALILLRQRGRSFGAVAVVLATWLAGAGITVVFASRIAKAGLLTREPIVGFWLNASSVDRANQYAIARQLAPLEIAGRANYPHQQTLEKRNVVLIIVDSLRADRMSLYGYKRPTTPFLDHLAHAGRLKVVQSAFSACSESTCGILSTLNSKPLRHIVHENFSITDLLRDQGYQVYRILSGNHEWNGLRTAYGDRQTFYFDGQSSKKYPLNDDRALFEGLDLVPDYHGSPAFFQFHLMSAHLSGIKHDEYRHFNPSYVDRGLEWLLNGQNLEVLSNSYDNGVLEADAHIEALFDQLRRKGYLDDSLVVILADHGEALGERGPKSIGHSNSLYQEYVHIPLLIYDRPDAAYGNLEFAAQVDVAPTIADRLGLAIPERWEGHSLREAVNDKFTIHQTNRWNPCWAVIRRTGRELYKYIRCDESPEKEEIYELRTDPHERRNLIAEAPPSLVAQFRDLLMDHLTRVPGSSD